MASLFQQGAFQQDRNATPESIARKRALIQAMMPQFGNADYVGEGLGQLFTGIGMGRQQRRLDDQEAQGRAGADSLFQQVLSGSAAPRQPAAGTGFSILGQAPMDEGQSIANDAMAAIGKPQMGAVDPGMIRQGLVQRGLPEHVADAFVVNMRDESGLNPGINEADPIVPGSRGGFGLYQLTGPRRVAYEQFAQQRGVPPSDVNAQLDFLMTELQGPEARAASRIMAAPDKATAAQSIVRDFLRPSPEHRERRAAEYAQLGGPAQTQQVQQGGDVPLENLMSAMANPFLSPDQRQVIASMIDQRQQAADPMRQMEMERAQLELDAMRNPQPETTSTQREYQMAVQQGFQGSFLDYQTALAEAKRPQTTINNDMGGGPAAPELLGTGGLVAIPDPTIPQGFRVEPAPGSPIATEQEAEKAARARRQTAKTIEADTITTAARRAREAAAARDFGSIGQRVVGAVIPQSDAAELARQVDTLKSNGTFSALQQMRDNSPTGAALGAASDRDLQLLADKAGSLDPGSPNIARDISDYERTLLRTLYGPEEGDRMFEATRQGADGAAAGNEDDELLRLYGGN